MKSMAKFQKLYCGENGSKKQTKKLPLELPRRSHKALMIHILASDEGENAKCAGTLNFVDLAGTIYFIRHVCSSFFRLMQVLCF